MTASTTAQVNSPVPGTPEYDAAMIARAEGEGVQFKQTDSRVQGAATSETNITAQSGDKPGDTPDDKPARPDWCPEKFWNAETGTVNAEALAKSYGELERVRKPAEAKPDEAKPDAAKPDGQAPDTPALRSAMDKAAADFDANGDITPESYAALEAAGISREYTEAYVEGLKARAESVAVKVYDAVGGKDTVEKMNAWAMASLSPEQIEAHNRAVTSGDFNATVGALKSLKALFEASEGHAPSRVNAENSTVNAGYASKAQMLADMGKPEYRTDPAFRASVARKVENAMRANVDLEL